MAFMMQSLIRVFGLVLLVPLLGALGCNGGGNAVGGTATNPPSTASVTNSPRSSPKPTSRPAGESTTKDVWFQDVTGSTGIDFRHSTGTSPERPFPAANGSGIATLDFDLDGNYDLYFATGSPFPLDPKRSEPINRCFRNLGDLKFQDVTALSGLGHNGYSAGLVIGDVDNDGFPDAYVVCVGANCLYHNGGDGTFERIEAAAGVNISQFGTSGAFFDYDRDGFLDVYACNYGIWSWETNPFCGDRQRNVRFYCSPQIITPGKDVLYHNSADGTFVNVTDSLHIEERLGRGQGVLAADFNDDGWIDIYVSNDLNPNMLLINDGGQGFRDISESSGAAYDFRGTAQAGMGLDAGDVDGDGDLELFVTNFEGEHNTLYRNMGGEMFQDVSHPMGLGADSIPWIGWGTSLSDFDLDGWLDVIVTNGHVDDNRELVGSDVVFKQPPLLWKNKQGRFSLVGDASGEYFREQHAGRALVVADLDNDGDQDVVIGHQDERPTVLKNARIGEGRTANWISLRLIGTESNRDAIGAKIALVSGKRKQTHQVKGGGSYESANDRRCIFGVAAGESKVNLEIVWPNGRRSSCVGLEAGHHHVITEPVADGISPGVWVVP